MDTQYNDPVPDHMSMASDDSMMDDVFESVEDTKAAAAAGTASSRNYGYPQTTKEGLHPSPTGYRDYQPPAHTMSSYDQQRQEELDLIVHKTILLGDSGVGKTSLLVQFDTGKFNTGTFSATVGIGFTVMLLGDAGVGKTCILVRFSDGRFLTGNFLTTVGVDYRNKVVEVDGVKVKLQIWDTAGQERFRSVSHAYYRDSHALLLLYDVTSKTSFDNIRAWLSEIREYAKDDVAIMLLGNKADCGPERVVRREDGERLAREYNVTFMETSAKTGENVDVAFIAVARELKSRKSGNQDQTDRTAFNIKDYVREQTQRGTCPPCSS